MNNVVPWTMLCSFRLPAASIEMMTYESRYSFDSQLLPLPTMRRSCIGTPVLVCINLGKIGSAKSPRLALKAQRSVIIRFIDSISISPPIPKDDLSAPNASIFLFSNECSKRRSLMMPVFFFLRVEGVSFLNPFHWTFCLETLGLGFVQVYTEFKGDIWIRPSRWNDKSRFFGRLENIARIGLRKTRSHATPAGQKRSSKQPLK